MAPRINVSSFGKITCVGEESSTATKEEREAQVDQRYDWKAAFNAVRSLE